MPLKILSIDVGLKNLGFIYASVGPGDGGRFDADVHRLGRVDLTRCRHRAVPRNRCTLRHDGHVSTRVLHFVQEHRDMFDAARVILVEQQPPTGLTSVEAILHAIFYHKVRPVSPVALHSFFGVRHLDYEGRKQYMVRLADRHLRGFEAYRRERRKHDVADAFAFIYFYYRREHLAHRGGGAGGVGGGPGQALEEREETAEETEEKANPFARYAYRGPLRVPSPRGLAPRPPKRLLRVAAAGADEAAPAERGVDVGEEEAGVARDGAAVVAVVAAAAVDADPLPALDAGRVLEGGVRVEEGPALGAVLAADERRERQGR